MAFFEVCRAYTSGFDIWSFIMRTALLALLPFAFATPIAHDSRAAKGVYWLLAGDSTTAPKGGWGDGYLATTVASGSSGHNYGHSGATTKSFRAGGDWGKVIRDVGTYKDKYDVYVTIQVNAFIPKKGVITWIRWLIFLVRPQRPKGKLRCNCHRLQDQPRKICL